MYIDIDLWVFSSEYMFPMAVLCLFHITCITHTLLSIYPVICNT